MKSILAALLLTLSSVAFAQVDQSAILNTVQTELAKNYVDCRPNLNVGSNLFSIWKSEIKLGFTCSEGESKLTGNVLLKGARIAGCSEEKKAELLAKVSVQPTTSECKTDSNGRETFEVLYIKKLELDVLFF